MPAKAILVVDEGHEDGSMSSYSIPFDNLPAAQRANQTLSNIFAAEGWRKQHECWVKGAGWRQKLIVYGGVEYAEEDGIDE